MSDGMALTFAEEVLRVVQNPLPLHQALRPSHARASADTYIHSSDVCTHRERVVDLVKVSASRSRLASVVAMVYETGLEGVVLLDRLSVERPICLTTTASLPFACEHH